MVVVGGRRRREGGDGDSWNVELVCVCVYTHTEQQDCLRLIQDVEKQTRGGAAAGGGRWGPVGAEVLTNSRMGGVATHPALVVLYSTLRIGLQGSGFFPSLGCLPGEGGCEQTRM